MAGPGVPVSLCLGVKLMNLHFQQVPRLFLPWMGGPFQGHCNFKAIGQNFIVPVLASEMETERETCVRTIKWRKADIYKTSERAGMNCWRVLSGHRGLVCERMASGSALASLVGSARNRSSSWLCSVELLLLSCVGSSQLFISLCLSFLTYNMGITPIEQGFSFLFCSFFSLIDFLKSSFRFTEKLYRKYSGFSCTSFSPHLCCTVLWVLTNACIYPSSQYHTELCHAPKIHLCFMLSSLPAACPPHSH